MKTADAVLLIVAVVGGLVLLIALLGTVFIVRHQTAGIIERFGRYRRIATSGIGFKIPIVDRVAGRENLRTRQLDVAVETKTQDNVFVNIHVSVQYRVPEDKVYEAFYMLDYPEGQIESYVFDVVRANVPEMDLDDVFVKKDSIADAVKQELQETMTEYGYEIRKALVNDIIPDAKVKISMNEINAAQRLRVAAREKAEAEKIMRVKEAEGEAESKRLQGEGIANQRRAIASGLHDSVDLLKGATGVDTSEVMKTVLLTQYLDTLTAMAASSRASTIFIPHSPGTLSSLEDQIRNAILTASAADDEGGGMQQPAVQPEQI
ncbi:MAG: SPFH domain-containing protein [Thermoleophilia bacterium]